MADFRYEATASFIALLEEAGCSLAVSAYMANRIVMLGAENGALLVQSDRFERPMGLAARQEADGQRRLAVASFQEVVLLGDAPLLGAAVPDETRPYRHLLVPRATLMSGDIDAHDLVWLGGELFAANTRFSCIARIDAGYSFTPVWQPPFISAVMPEDRCHLNGLAADGDRVLYATAFNQGDSARSWSAPRMDTGVLMAVPSGEIVLKGLWMPHSPRVFDGKLYVLESGTGRVLQIDPAARRTIRLAELPGFTRGFDRLGDVLFVGLSRFRERANRRLPLQDRFPALDCGVTALDRNTGKVLGWLRFTEGVDEIFDIKVLPDTRNAAILGPHDARHRRALALPGRAFWAGPLGGEHDPKKP